MKRVYILLGAILLCSNLLAQYNPDITIDGSYCNNVASGDPGPDEWVNAENQSYTGATSSCEMSELSNRFR